MQTEQLPSQIKAVWTYSALISGGVGLLISLALWLTHVYLNWWFWLPLAAVGLSLLDVIVELAVIPYRYAFSRYRITETAVYVRTGVFFKHEIAVPINRIQNVTLAAGPLLQFKQLREVAVDNAATRYSINGVTVPVAERLRDQILQLAREARDDA